MARERLIKNRKSLITQSRSIVPCEECGKTHIFLFQKTKTAMLFENGKFKIKMGEDKNELCTAGIILNKYY